MAGFIKPLNDTSSIQPHVEPLYFIFFWFYNTKCTTCALHLKLTDALIYSKKINIILKSRPGALTVVSCVEECEEISSICDCIQITARSVAQVHISPFSHQQSAALLNVGQVIFMLHMFLDVWCW